MEKLNIGGRAIGPGELPYIIAEIGANHNGDMELCRRIIDAAVESGAGAKRNQGTTSGDRSRNHYLRRAISPPKLSTAPMA